MKYILVICWSQTWDIVSLQKEAFLVGQRIAQTKNILMYGWVQRGLMKEVANGCREYGGKVQWYYSEFLENCEDASKDWIETVFLKTNEERKEQMFWKSDMCIVFPWWFWTLSELAELLLLKQGDFYDKPIYIYNKEGFYENLSLFLEGLRQHQFIQQKDTQGVIIVNELQDLLTKID